MGNYQNIWLIILFIPVLAWGRPGFSTIEPPKWIKATVESQPPYWDNADGSVRFCVARKIAERHEWRYGDSTRTRTILTGIVIVPPDTMWAYCQVNSDTLRYFHQPVCLEGDTINFSTRDEGVSCQDSYPKVQENWVVPLKAIRPRGNP